jgi:SRSO17 transposase
VRRALDDPTDCASYRAFGPAAATADDLVRVAGARWTIEEGFGQAKGEVGVDQDEVRRWDAWHRHITLGLLAHAALAVISVRVRCDAATDRAKGGTRRTGS